MAGIGLWGEEALQMTGPLSPLSATDTDMAAHNPPPPPPPSSLHPGPKAALRRPPPSSAARLLVAGRWLDTFSS